MATAATSRLSLLIRRSTATEGRLSYSARRRFISVSSKLLQEPTKAGAASSAKEFPSNDSIEPAFINNRNPRNLERLRIGEKPAGWTLEQPGRCFWHKLSLEITGKHIQAKVEHHSGRVPATASSKEWCIRKFLYSTRDICAIRAVGRVLAQRCLELGIYEVFTTFNEQDRKKEKIEVFLTAFDDAGITLSEPEQYEKPIYLNEDKLPEKGWEVFDDIIVKDFPTNLEVQK